MKKNANLKVKVNEILNWIYYPCIFLLFILQAVYTFNSTNQIRYEELVESIRNVYWMQEGLVYDGISTNIGWYATLLYIYKIFGFGLHTAKYFRLILHLISLFCLVSLLKKYLEKTKSLIPLIIIGLSPTWLYFNTLQTSYGIDLQYFPICLWLLTVIKFKQSFWDIFKNFLFFFLIMLAWMSYPVFIAYIPSLLICYIWRAGKLFKKQFANLAAAILLVDLAAFFLPLIIGTTLISNDNILWSDPVTKGGIFRGAGRFIFEFKFLAANLGGLFKDLFFTGSSYHFELIAVEFSGLYSPVFVIFILSIIIYLLFFGTRKDKYLIGLFLLILFFAFITNFSLDPTGKPGIRRNTPLLSVFYGFLVISWNYINSKNIKKLWVKIFLGSFFILFLIHHLWAWPKNLLSLKNPSKYRDGAWFMLDEESPSKSFKKLTGTILFEDLILTCDQCRYSEIYGALAGYCRWNNLSCRQIIGFDYKSKKHIPLSTKLWTTYYWEH